MLASRSVGISISNAVVLVVVNRHVSGPPSVTHA